MDFCRRLHVVNAFVMGAFSEFCRVAGRRASHPETENAATADKRCGVFVYQLSGKRRITGIAASAVGAIERSAGSAC